MIRLRADVAEIQGLAQAQSQRQQPFTGIASQWSAANAGMGPSPLGPLAQANPLPAGLAAPTAEPMPIQAPAQRQPLEVEEVERSWQQTALGTALGPWGAAAGGVIGGLGGLLGG
jgi:hypothetical protein